ncbi:MAG: AraC family transcriptional regulator [Pseudomonadota bacterium]
MQFDYKKRISTKIDDHPVGKLLDNLRMESAFFTASNFSSPWAAKMPEMANCMMFHIIVEGTSHFQVEDKVFTLQKGDFVLFPKGEGHVLSDGQCTQITPLADLPIRSVTERYETLDFGGDGEKSTLVCGVLLFQHPLAIKLLGILPSHIIIKEETQASASAVRAISDLLASETQRIAVGADAVIGRLADIMVISAMREYLNGLGDSEIGWLSALQDDRIGRSLTLLHEYPEKHWSLEELASEVGMSRTSFAQQFKRLVSNTPMDYLTEWRMSLAYSKLQMSDATILSIALDIGYQSEAAFSRAFKKIIGKRPSDVRKAYSEQH